MPELQIFDISRPYSQEMPVWPGSRPFLRSVLKSPSLGDAYTESEIALNIHTGTHVDAPLHFVNGGAPIDSIPLQTFFVEVQVVDLSEVSIVGPDDLAQAALTSKHVLLRTKNSNDEGPNFNPQFVSLSTAAARWLTSNGFKMIGIDGPSVQAFSDPNNETHEVLLGAGIVIIENLMLREVPAGIYRLCCFPLKIKGAEGAPARAVLLPKRWSS